MKVKFYKTIFVLFIILLMFPLDQSAQRRQNKFPTTPLSEKILDILANEISGQIIFNNEVRLAGAPWIRDTKEFTETLYEAEEMIKLVKSYGINTVKLIKNKTEDCPPGSRSGPGGKQFTIRRFKGNPGIHAAPFQRTV